MTLKVFNKEVLFSEEEVKTFKNNKLDLSSEVLEVILLSDNISDLSNIPSQNTHDLCVKAIQNYADLVVSTLDTMSKEGLV